MKWGSNNFLVRTRKMFEKHGFMVAVVDAPYDRNVKSHLSFDRTSKDHLIDIRAVISFLKQKKPVPVWLVGTSRGTTSATHIAVNNSGQCDGLVLTSTMSSVGGMDLEKIRIPTLIVSHREDECWPCPPEAAEMIAKGLINSPKVEVKYFSGGYAPRSEPCQALSEHGFYGIEGKVVDAIAHFIKSN